MSLKKRFLFSIVAVAMGLVLLEGICRLIFLIPDYRTYRQSKPRAIEMKEDRHTRYNSELGWEHIPGKRIPDFYGEGRNLTINSQGFRGLSEISPQTPPDKYRVVCLGDSFTLGYGVGDEDTYPAKLEGINPAVQTVNMGQAAYSVGQCFLWLKREITRMDSDFILFALIPNDLDRMASDRLPNGYATPSFKLREGRIEVGNQPIPAKIETNAPMLQRGDFLRFLAQDDPVARSVALVIPRDVRGGNSAFVQSEELMNVSLAIFAATRDLAREGRAGFGVVLFPTLDDIRESNNQSSYFFLAGRIRSFARVLNIPFLDMRPAFIREGKEKAAGFYLDEEFHHLNPAGTAFVAGQINQWLKESVPGYPGSGGKK